MDDELLVPVLDEGLGNVAYLVDLGDGRALAVDASRDLRELRRAADRRGLTVAFAADTHLHADFLSGAIDLAAGGARVLASAAGGRAFPHDGLTDGDEFDLGGLTLRAIGTPGHTGEHLAYLLLDGPAPLGVFTGGSLLVGAAARTDLSGPQRTEELARAQWHSLRRLAELPGPTRVWPTHGAGSFCSAPPGAERTSTIAHEKATNPLLAIADEATFACELTAQLGTYPPYFLRLPEQNRRGPAPVQHPPRLTQIAVPDVAALLAGGGQLVDVRPIEAFAAGHVPGSLSIPLRPVFATWLGWVVDPDQPVIVVRDRGQDPEEIAWQALKIGYDNLVGELADGVEGSGVEGWGFEAWAEASLPVSTIALVGPDAARATTVVDVRQDAEYAAGHVPGAVHLELGGLQEAATCLPEGPLTMMCGHGERAMTAASVLARAGRRDLAVLAGGPDEWAIATGQSTTTQQPRTDS